jgi:hypothetical protein
MSGDIPYHYIRGSVNNFIRSRFITAGLAGLAEHGEAADITIARRYLMESKYDEPQLTALRIIVCFGNQSDIPALVRIAKDNYGERKELAAKVALSLDPGVQGIARTFLRTEDTRLVEWAIQSLWDEDRKEVVELLEPLLTSKNSRTRLKALAYFVQKCSEEKLVETMSAYSSATSPYYYDVVSWLDKILFAPSPLQKAFRRQLTEEG